LSALLDKAFELAPGDLDTWLTDLDTSQPLVAAELRSLLAEKAAIDANGFLQPAAHESAVPISLAGRRIGAYTLESLLGEGGMGTVWLARRSDGRFEGQVAIKLLSFALVGRPSEQRFTREGSLLARLQHPNVARLADAGVADHGQPYLVLEYVQGERIDLYCERHQLDVIARIRLFLDVLAAVAHAHSHLIVHRDLKPGNILVTRDGVVKLLDFGVAALLADEAQKPELTRELGTALTPEYAAPEQLTEAGITTATDVYALGLVLFVLLVGRHPISTQDLSRAELLRATLDKEPPAASSLAGDPRLKRALRGDLDNIIARALRPRPAERYASAAAFADDLRRFLALEPIEARPASLTYRARRFVRRNVLAIGISGAVALALIATTAFALWQMFDAREQRDNARFEARRAEASSEFMSLVFEEVGPSGAPLSIRELLDRGVALLNRQNGADPAILSRMLVQASRRYLDMGDNHSQRELLKRAIELAQSAGAYDVIASARCAGVRGYVESGMLSEAREQLRLADEALSHVGPRTVEPRVDCLRATANTLTETARYEESLKVLEQARVLLESSGSTRGLQYTSVLNDQGFILFRTGQHLKALANAELLAGTFQRNGRGGTYGMTVILNNIASNHFQLGEVLASEVRMRAVAARQSTRSPEPTTLVNHGNILLRLERADEALPPIQRALQIATSGRNVDREIAARISLARVHVFQGALDQAARELTTVDGLFPQNPDLFVQRRRLAEAAKIELSIAQGELAAARTRGEQLLSSVGYPRQREMTVLKTLLPLMARVAVLERNSAQARTYASAALKIARSVARPGGQSADVGEALLLLAETGALVGDLEPARRAGAEAVAQLQASLGPGHSLTQRAKALSTPH
jgi:serine/threonine-protein kinase